LTALPDDYGKTIAEEYGSANAPDGEIIYSALAPIMPDGGVPF